MPIKKFKCVIRILQKFKFTYINLKIKIQRAYFFYIFIRNICLYILYIIKFCISDIIFVYLNLYYFIVYID